MAALYRGCSAAFRPILWNWTIAQGSVVPANVILRLSLTITAILLSSLPVRVDASLEALQRKSGGISTTLVEMLNTGMVCARGRRGLEERRREREGARERRTGGMGCRVLKVIARNVM